jgi:8-oxo-dGTP pyrophosphatase MutT (NUDIX family)
LFGNAEPVTLIKLPKSLRPSHLWIRARNVARDEVTGLPQQTGALPWWITGKKLQFLLVTGRLSKRWTVPKGWPMYGKTLAEAAAQEAFEEAGVEGRIETQPIGRFDHTKTHAVLGPLDVTILVFPMEATRLLSRWPERDARERKWLSPAKAAKLVENSQLRAILLDFAAAREAR